MYIVIYDKVTKKILRIIEKTDKVVSYGYSDNCAEVILQEKPEGQYVSL